MDEPYIVSARKYRPQSFETVVGQSALTATLQNAVTSGHLAHAYLFCGPRGVGKTTCARIFAKTINAIGPDDDLDQYAFNIHELDAASNNSVEDIRQIIREVMIPPQVGRYSVFIIDEVHMLSTGAFNALLKTLEEPPSYAIFILATTEKHKVLPTILSRCQVYDFSRITVTDIIAHLRTIATREGVTVSDESLNVIAQKADGGMRDALSIFDQLVSFAGTDISYQRTLEILNVLDSDYYFRLVDLALAGDVAQSLLLLDEVLNRGFDAQQFLVGLMQHLRDVLVCHDAATARLLETSDTVRAHYVEQAKSCSAQWLFRALDILNTTEIQFRTARNKRLSLELGLIRFVAPVVQAAPAAAPARPAPQAAPVAPAAPARPVAPAAPVAPSAPVRPTAPAAPTAPTPPPPPPSPVSPVAPPPFANDQFEQAWTGLCSIYRDQIRLVTILRECLPVRQPDGHYLLMVDNAWQAELFTQTRREIYTHLSQALGGAELTIEVQIRPQDPKRFAYRPQDRYRLMAEANPSLEILKQKLDLSLD